MCPSAKSPNVSSGRGEEKKHSREHFSAHSILFGITESKTPLRKVQRKNIWTAA